MKLPFARQHVPVLATAGVWLALYAAAGVAFRDRHFLSLNVLDNLFSENAFLGLAALGETFVILSGGIDLSVGAMIGCSSVIIAMLIAAGFHPLAAAACVLAGGAAFGTGMGALIHRFRLPPFLVTLAGMFLLRGTGLVLSSASLAITHPLYFTISDWRPAGLSALTVILLAAFTLGIALAHLTRFGRNVYALGGSESAALLMGLPVARTHVGVYALSGLCSAAAGVVYTLYTFSGHAKAGEMLELDAIATVVIGGTLLAGGVGYVFGTLIGVLIFGTIQTAIMFHGDLNSWWTRIAVGTLLLAFILLQKLVQGRAGRAGGPP
jgi:ribose/xylose/arabinose/galactoside ABC-type transport system permease subunit